MLFGTVIIFTVFCVWRYQAEAQENKIQGLPKMEKIKILPGAIFSQGEGWKNTNSVFVQDVSGNSGLKDFNPQNSAYFEDPLPQELQTNAEIKIPQNRENGLKEVKPAEEVLPLPGTENQAEKETGNPVPEISPQTASDTDAQTDAQVKPAPQPQTESFFRKDNGVCRIVPKILSVIAGESATTSQNQTPDTGKTENLPPDNTAEESVSDPRVDNLASENQETKAPAAEEPENKIQENESQNPQNQESPKTITTSASFSAEFELSKFGADESLAKIKAANAQVRFSFAAAAPGQKMPEPNEFKLSYSLSGSEWRDLTAIPLDKEISNLDNGGYFLAALPEIQNFKDFGDLKLKFVYNAKSPGSGQAVYLDAAWIEAEYSNDKPNIDVARKFTREKPVLKLSEIDEDGFWEKLWRFVTFKKSKKISFEIKNPQNKTGENSYDRVGNDITIIEGEKSGFFPGKYSLIETIDDNGAVSTVVQEFSLGVLAVNTDKPVYRLGDTAHLQMGALDAGGHTLCNANLKLEITDPSGTTTIPAIFPGGECGADNFTLVPDYFSDYQTQLPGIYNMKLVNLDSGDTITDNFEVSESLPFEIRRTGPSRINPVYGYRMTLEITANKNYKGSVIEHLPQEFTASSTDMGLSQTAAGADLSWDVDWKAGETHQIIYTFNAPAISPYRYFLGPLSIGTFIENREWQIAADFLPQTNIDKIESLIGQNKHITNKYRFDNSTFIKPAETKNHIKTEIGEPGRDEFEPSLKISKWDNEVSLKIMPDISQVAKKDKKINFDGEKIKYMGGKIDYVFYDFPATSEDGGYEFEIVLNEKPADNVFILPVETQNLEFYPQMPLNEEKQEPGSVCSATQCKDNQGRVLKERPEDIVDSIAVYAAGKTGDFTALGGMNYMSGKVAHIKRIKMIDNAGNAEYCKQAIAHDQWTITCPQIFLDNAVYPVMVDPTFGYTTKGGTQESSGNRIRGSVFAAAAGTGTSISMYIGNQWNGMNYKFAIYDHSSLALLTNGTTVQAAYDGLDGWHTLNFTSAPTFTATDYIVAGWGSANNYFYYDAGSDNQGHYQTVTYGAWPDPLEPNHASTNKYSIYATYEAAPENPTNNIVPAFSAAPHEDPTSDAATPTDVGDNIIIKATATDANNDQWYLAVCKTNSIATSSDAAPTCPGGEWGISTATASSSEATVTYQATTTDAESNDWYAFACDKTATTPQCSAMSNSGTSGNNGSPFEVNHRPVLDAVSNNGPADPGGTITITASTTDSNGDNLSFFACKSNDWDGDSCGAAGEWCNATGSSWGYRKQINITGQSGAGTNYQVKLLIGETSGAAGENFDLGGHTTNFPNDIKFTDNDEATNLDFWVESISGTTPNRLATVWVEVADNLDSNQSIYIYYGKFGQTSLSSGKDTFIIFDDWESGKDVSYWTFGGDASPYWNLDGSTKYAGSYSAANADIGNSQTVYFNKSTSLSSAGKLNFVWKVSSESGWDWLYYCINNESCTQSSGYADRISGTVEWTSISANLSSGANNIRFAYGKDDSMSSGSDTGWIDNIMVRKYIATEPAWANASAEETASAALSCDISIPNPTAAGTQNYYPYVIDSHGLAASGGEHGQLNTFTVNNIVPAFSAAPHEDPTSDAATPTDVGDNVIIKATATDANNDQWYLAVCKTNSVATSSDAAPTCPGGEWAISDATDAGNEATTTYTASSTDSESNIWYAFACDKTASDPKCSAMSNSGTSGNNGSPFVVNHRPALTAVSIADSTLDPGATTTITALANDEDISSATDTIDLYVCKSNDFANGACGAGGTWCTASSTVGESWGYRKQISLTGQSGAGTNYQIKLLIGETSGATGENFDLGGHATNFPNDIKFTDNDGATNLDFWVESTTNTTPNRLATVWVEVTDNLDSNQNIYIYYGKSGQASLSNGDNTFLFFDDFNDSSINSSKWTTAQSGGTCTSIAEANGYLRFSTPSQCGGNKIYMVAASQTTFTYPMTIESNMRLQASDVHGSLYTGSAQSCTYDVCTVTGFDNQRNTTTYGNPTFGISGGSSTATATLTANTWSRRSFKLSSGANALAADSNNYTNSSTFSRTYDYLKLIIRKWAWMNATYDYDFVFIRKYSATEPVYSSAGSEEAANHYLLSCNLTVPNPQAAGTVNYYGYVIDSHSLQASGGQQGIQNTFTVNNILPAFSVAPHEDPVSATTTPTNVGENITISASSTDSNGGQWYLAVCKTNEIATSSDAAPTCPGGEWGISGATDSGSEAIITYQATTTDAESNPWYAFACDKTTSNPKCSEKSNSGIEGNNGSPFAVNHRPTFTAIGNDGANDPGEQISIEAQEYNDADTGGSQDTVSMYICKSNDFTGSACGAAGTWCSVTGITPTNPLTCELTVPNPQAHGPVNYYAYVIDNHSLQAFGGQQGQLNTFSVNDVAPTISGTPTLNNAAAIDLTAEKSTTDIYIRGVVADDNGCSDINAASTTADAWLTSITRSACDSSGEANNNNCYPRVVCAYDATVESCGANDKTGGYKCTVSFQYYANPTDANTPWSASTWTGTLVPADGQGTNAAGEVNTAAQELNSFLALGLTDGYNSINFGEANPGNTTDPLLESLRIEAVGNCSANVNAYGTAMTSGSYSIAPGYQRYGLGDTAPAWSAGTALSETETLVNLGICKSGYTATPEWKRLWWGINTPSTQASGDYAGTNYLIAVKKSWAVSGDWCE